MKKYFVLFMVLAFCLAGAAKAEENNPSVKPLFRNTGDKRAQLEAEFKKQREILRKELESRKIELKDERNEEREALKAEFKEKRIEFKEKTPEEREAIKNELKAKKDEFKAKIEADREAFKKDLEAKKAEFKEKIAEKRGEFRGKALQMIDVRFEAAFTNIERAQERIGAIIGKLTEAGRDTASAQESLDFSKEKLAEAKNKVAEVKALIPSSDEKVTVETFEKIKIGANEAKNLLKESHNALREALAQLKTLK